MSDVRPVSISKLPYFQPVSISDADRSPELSALTRDIRLIDIRLLTDVAEGFPV